MTDADLWRAIAKAQESTPMGNRLGLCECLPVRYHWMRAAYLEIRDADPAQYTRMRQAMQAFKPRRLCRLNGGGWWGWEDTPHEARVLAACFLAAMADYDGGNHAADG